VNHEQLGPGPTAHRENDRERVDEERPLSRDAAPSPGEQLPHDWLRELFDRAPVLIFGKDLEGRYLFVNECLTQALDIPASKMQGHTDEELFGSEAARRFTAEDRRVAQLQEVREFQEYFDASDGKRELLTKKFPLYDHDGKLSAVGGISVDITERKRLESYRALLVEAGEQLAESLDLKTTLETIANLAARHLSRTFVLDLMDADGKIVREIARCELQSPQTVLEKMIEYAPLLPAAHPVRRAFASGTPVSIARVTPEMLDNYSVDARHRQLLEELGIQSALSIPLLARGRGIGVLSLSWAEPGIPTAEVMAIASALASRAALAIDNAQLLANWKDAARLREEVVGVISHDLRNPLQAILLASGLVYRSDDDMTPRQQQGMARIRSAAERMSRLIYALLDFTRVRAGALKIERVPLDFHRLVRDVCEEHVLAWPDRSIEVVQNGRGEGEWDEARLSQIVANLVANALQHSPADRAVRVRSEGTDREVRLTVHNEGEPIDQALLPEIFEAFRRGAGDAKGSVGLGLYIAQQVAVAHGGAISVESSAQAGTTFTVRLPRHAEAANAGGG
jgi:PAS domain S-box-containing protein